MVGKREVTLLKDIGFFSRYLGRLLENKKYYEWLVDRGGLQKTYPLMELYTELKEQLSGLNGLDEIKRSIREFKQRHFLRLGARDFLKNIEFQTLVLQISYIAEVCLQVGIEILLSKPTIWKKDSFVPIECEFCILGLGKLGGRELNYVSDIDLIYIYNPNKTSHSCHLYTYLVRCLNSIIGDMFEGDRVFNVDMRLRPKGRYGELIQSYESAIDHYLLSGSSWERQALLKARGVAGDRNLATLFLNEVRPFVFRRFLDFQAIDEIRSMRDKILKEIGQKTGDVPEDVKLGIGGIREIEFIVQAFQLIYGGRYPELMESNTILCMEKLRKLKLIPLKVLKELRDAYIFLRRVEHWIQLDDNRQSSKIPRSTSDRRRLSCAMGFDTWDDFLKKLKTYASFVHTHFRELFSKAKKQTITKDSKSQKDNTYKEVDKDIISLSCFGPTARLKVKDLLNELSKTLSDDAFYGASKRIQTFLNRIEKRPGLMKYLEENLNSTIEIISMIGRSRFFSEFLCSQPSLIEGIIEGTKFREQEDWKIYASRIIEPLDFADAVEWMRKIKNERILYFAMQDIKGMLGLKPLLYNLTDVAEFVINAAYSKVLEYTNTDRELPLAILGLGKLGSKELGYFSDLDLMFVYEPVPHEDPEIIPDKVIKLVQRFNNILRMPLQEGPGYEIDTRLRPTGNYGPLIVTLSRWNEYYNNEADIWEIQSLLRLRPIAGNPYLCEKIKKLKIDICFKQRDKGYVWEKISYMRNRIINERAKESKDVVDIKVGRGGMIDIEFIVQGLFLSQAISSTYMEKDTLSILDRMFDLLSIDMEFSNLLKQVYKEYISLLQRVQLLTNLNSSRISRKKFLDAIQMGLWPACDSPLIEAWEDIQKYKKLVDRFWEHFLTIICN